MRAWTPRTESFTTRVTPKSRSKAPISIRSGSRSTPSWKQATAEAASLEATQTATAAQIVKAQEQVKQLLTDSVENDRLQRMVDTEKQCLRVLPAPRRRSARGRRAQSQQNPQREMAEPPNRPMTPTYPIVPLNLGVGVLLALACAFGVAYLEESLDPRIYSAGRIDGGEGLKTIAQLRELNQE